jgi:hypothetical protein
MQRVTKELPHVDRELHQILLATPNPNNGLFGFEQEDIIPEQV